MDANDIVENFLTFWQLNVSPYPTILFVVPGLWVGMCICFWGAAWCTTSISRKMWLLWLPLILGEMVCALAGVICFLGAIFLGALFAKQADAYVGIIFTIGPIATAFIIWHILFNRAPWRAVFLFERIDMDN